MSGQGSTVSSKRHPTLVATPTRRVTPGGKPVPKNGTTQPVTLTRKLPFQQRPELGPKHRRAEVAGLSRAVVPVRNSSYLEMGGLETTSQRILNEQLVRLTTLLLRSQSAKTSHDSAAVRDHAYQRAHEVVDVELSRIITKLVNMQGPSPMHRVVALSQLSSELTRDVERAIFTDERAVMANVSNEQRVRQEESALAHASFAQELKAKDQVIASLLADRAELESRNTALARKCDAQDKELEKANRNQAQTHQNAVELRMQGLDFKARVDNRCARILASIQSRMGFIPAGIQKQVLYLKVLKAPGDPAYDEMRMHTHTRISKKRFELPGDRDRKAPATVAGGGRLSSWGSAVLDAERPAALPRPRTAPHGQQQQQRLRGGRGGGDADVQAETLRRPRSQEDWVRWAMPSSSSSSSSSAAAGGGGADRQAEAAARLAYGTFGEGVGDEFDDEDDEDDEDYVEEEDEEDDDDDDDDEEDSEEEEEGEDEEDEHEGGNGYGDSAEDEARLSDYLFLNAAGYRGNGVSVLGGER